MCITAWLLFRYDPLYENLCWASLAHHCNLQMKRNQITRGDRRDRQNKSSGGRDPLIAQYKWLVDRGWSISDGSATSIQDAQQFIANSVPILIPRNLRNQIHWFTSSYQISFNSSTATPVTGAFTFQLSSVNDYTSYQAVFDQYAIVAAVVRIIPDSSSAITNTGPLLTAIDYDDATAPTSLLALREYATLVSTGGREAQTRVVYPRMAVAAYSGAFTSYANQRSWVDIASSSVQYFGLKYGIDTTTTAISYDVEISLVFCCRNNR